METTWESVEGDGWGDGAGVTMRMYSADDEDEYGYMRGNWGEMKIKGGEEGGGAGEGRGQVRRVCRTYDTIEGLKEDTVRPYTRQ